MMASLRDTWLAAHPRRVALALLLAGSACAQVTSGSGQTGSGGSGNGSGTGGIFSTGSGGVFGGGGGAGGVPGLIGGGGGERACGLETFPLVRTPVDIMVLLDRSASMARDSTDTDIPAGSTLVSKWNQVVPALIQVIGKVGGDTSWALKSFPEDGAQCVQSTLTTKIDVPMAPMNSAQIGSVVMATTPAGNGTPTGGAFNVATTYLRSLANDHRKYILFATDGQPSCSGGLGTLAFVGGGNVAAVSAATTAITAAAQAGFHTFVVGVATKPSDTLTLNAWAQAGLEPRNDPNPLATKFYLGATQSELVSAFSTITNIAQTCVFALSKPPPVPEKIAVKVSGVKAPEDTTNTNGWNYVDSTHMAVQVFGSWCDMIKTSAADMVDIVFGCPNIDIP